VHANYSSDHAAHLVRCSALSEGIAALTDKPILHGGNGSTLKATAVLAMLELLGLKPSYSRLQAVMTAPMRSQCFVLPSTVRSTLQRLCKLKAARQWGAAFVPWYNEEHKHSSIRYVSPQ
jgi:putative transposase